MQLRRDPDEQLAEYPSAFLTRDQRPGLGLRSRARPLHEPAAGRPGSRPAGQRMSGESRISGNLALIPNARMAAFNDHVN